MCRRTKLWGLLLTAMGLGLLAASLLSSVVLQLLLGIVLVSIGLLLAGRR